MLPASLAAKWLPKDFVEATPAGGVFTLIAYILMSIVFILEMTSFLRDSDQTVLSLERSPSRALRINFDIDLFDLECRNLKLLVTDEFGKEPVHIISQNYKLKSIESGVLGARHKGDHDETIQGSSEEQEEKHHQELHKQLEEQFGTEEFDADWASSHDGFKHQNFEHVIEYHDFTVVNFFAEWCVHCRQFSPTWSEIAKAVNGRKFVDVAEKERDVRAVKMNCVDFRTVCKEQGIDEFPTIRLYRSDGSSSRFEGHRSLDAIVKWVENGVKMKASGWAKHHTELELGCNTRGYVDVPKGPGYLELFAGGRNHALDPSMTNVSHVVKHLSFADPSEGFFQWSFISNLLPFTAAPKFTKPIDGRVFSTHEFHETFEHHIRIISYKNNDWYTYLFSHYDRISKSTNLTEVPQAKFHFDIDSFGIEVVKADKKWYDFCTSLMAMLGGVFSITRLCSMSTRGVAKVAQRSMMKGGARASVNRVNS